ncbi:hypothetical protein AAMO2058_001712900 [Amorphochlora amoebiformis]
MSSNERIVRMIGAFGTAVLIALQGYKKKSLSFDGAIAAALVGGITLSVTWRFGLTLLLFYFVSSKLTKIGLAEKAKIEAHAKKDATRGSRQVLGASLTAVIISLVYVAFISVDDLPIDYLSRYWASFFLCAYMGFFSCSCGDTWASEIGKLSKAKTATMITTFKPVPKGTNGGVTTLGTLASIAGGIFIGIIFWLVGWISTPNTDVPQWPLVPYGAALGGLGSLIDSILGATLQETCIDSKSGKIVSPKTPGARHVSGLDICSNEGVNLISSTAVALIAGFGGSLIF